MSRTKRDIAIFKSNGFRRCKTFRNLKAEQAALDAMREDGFTDAVSNRVSTRSNKWSGVHPSRDDREIAAIRELPSSVRGW